MIKLQINEITKKVIGIENSDAEVYETNVVDSIADFIEYSDNGTSFFKDNVYFINGKLQLVENAEKDYFDIVREKSNQLLLLKKEIGDIGTNIAYKIADGLTLEEIAAEINEKRSAVDALQAEIDELNAKYSKDLSDYYAAEDLKLKETLNNKYYSSVCLLIKNENEYLEEWINHYLSIGIDHIYIYDNGSTESVTEIVYTLSDDIQKKITIIPYRSTSDTLQQDAYNEFLANYGEETRWAALVDSDEFIHILTEDENINSFLQKYEDKGAIYMKWKVFNANGQRYKTEGLVQERFTTEVPEPVNHLFSKNGKLFLQPYKVESIYRYYPQFRNGNDTFANEDMNESIISLYHYYTKSLEEWTEKIERGSCDARYLKNYQEFFTLNPDMVEFNTGSGSVQAYNV